MLACRRRLVGVALLALLCLVSCVGAHYADPRTKAFTVHVTDSGEQVASVGSGSASVQCSFSYTTIPADSSVVQDKDSASEEKDDGGGDNALFEAPSDLQQLLGKMKDTCVSKKIGYWDYEVCLGSSIKQYHNPDVYQLGQFVRFDGDNMIFDNGAACEARQDKKPRSVSVSFACSRDKTTFLDNIQETTVCEYVATVATPLVCGISRFPTVAGGAARRSTPTPAQPAEVKPDDGSEDWFLRLSELADGRFMCSVYTTELRAAGSKLTFGKFALELKATNLPRPSDVPSTAVAQYIARHPGRIPIASNSLVTVFGGSDGKQRSSSLSSSASFNGKLAHVKVFI